MLALDLRDLSGPDAYDNAADALEAVGLGHRINAMPSKMSGGEKQRVSIARALAGSPSVILADEPTAALDAKNGMAVMELLAKVAQDTRRAVLAVTHDHRTLQFADRIITIDDGRIAGSERPKLETAAKYRFWPSRDASYPDLHLTELYSSRMALSISTGQWAAHPNPEAIWTAKPICVGCGNLLIKNHKSE